MPTRSARIAPTRRNRRAPTEPLFGVTGLTAAGTMTATLRQAVAGDETAFARIATAHHGDMLGSTHTSLSDAGWKVFLAAFPKAAQD